MTDFHFLRPWWLLALPLLAALLWALYRRQLGGGDWRDHCDPALLPYVLVGTPARPARHPLWLAGLAGLLAVLALAGPAWERLPTPVFRNLSALVVVLDLSGAMNAADLKPNRLERARFKIDDILRARKDGQTALVAYAGDAFTVTPLTDDAATIAAQLGALNPGLMPVPGSRPDLGLATAARLLKQAGLKSGDVLLVAGDTTAAADSQAAALNRDGYRLSVLGTGTQDGAPVPLPGGGFLKDEHGNILVPRLDAAGLARLAQTGGGIYHALTPASADLDALLGFFDHRAAGAEQTGDTVHIEQWREAGVWLLPPLLLLAALGFRRGWLGLWVLLVLAPTPEPALALDWQDLWLTPDQRAQREFQAGHPDEAAQHFRDPDWKAAADYKAGHYPEAAKALENATSATGQYNRGNALAQQGQYREALAAYEQALKLDPHNEDARHNKQQVEAALRQQQEQQKPQDKQNQQDKQDKQDGQKQDQGQQPQQSGQNGSEPSPQENQDQQGKQDGKDPGQPQADKEQDGQEHADGKNPKDAEAANKQPKPGQKDQTVKPDRPAPTDKPEGQPDPAQQAQVPTESPAQGEIRQAEEQWLRRIPDDPGGLLKRKFAYQHQQHQQRQNPERTPW